MPQLDAKEYARIALIIDELKPLAEDESLYEAANGFVIDQAERKAQYGERMFLSPKQVAWLEKLHDEYVGTAEPEGPKGVDEKIRDVHGGQGDMDEKIRDVHGGQGDMDDDIPF